MSKETAVEWLIAEIQRLPLEHRLEKQHLYYHALKMEKEQIIEAYMKAKLEHTDTLGLNAMKNKIIKVSEDYYNQTYGGDE
jgi:hypothetical protein